MPAQEYVRVCALADTCSHTRFHVALRSAPPDVTYHRLLLFRVGRAGPAGSSGTLADGDGDERDERDDRGEGDERDARGAAAAGSSRTRDGASGLGGAVRDTPERARPGETHDTDAIGETEDADPELYCMEETCPHLGAPLSHAELADVEDTRAVVCPWHQYDFATGLQACVYDVQVRDAGAGRRDVWVEAPHAGGRGWELVEFRGVSEDPPVPSLAALSLDDASASSAPPLPVDPADPPAALPTTLLGFAHLVLATADPARKCALTREAVARLRAGQLSSIRPSAAEVRRARADGGLLDEPPRLQEITGPYQVPKRGTGASEKSRVLMLHALANIEQYAIDLAWDIIARFADVEVDGARLPVEYFLDWAKVAEDEAKHFALLSKRLVELGSYFGAHKVHAGLWESATDTAHSLSARIAIIHLVAEARGVDMNPLTLAKLRAAGDAESTRVLEIIHADEITHVTTGHRWFTWLCQKRGVDPVAAFRAEVAANFHGKIKGPFNAADRLKAGLTPEFYEDLAGAKPSNRARTTYPAPSKGDGDEHMHPRLT